MVPPSGFHTLLAFYSSPSRPGFFHPGGALRVFALRSFPLGDRSASSAIALPACRWLSARLPGFDPSESPSPSSSGVSLTSGARLPWVFPLQGFPPPDGASFEVILPRACAGSQCGPAVLLGVLLVRRLGILVARLPPLLEFRAFSRGRLGARAAGLTRPRDDDRLRSPHGQRYLISIARDRDDFSARKLRRSGQSVHSARIRQTLVWMCGGWLVETRWKNRAERGESGTPPASHRPGAPGQLLQ